MIKILISILAAQPVLAWSLIDPNSDAIRTGVVKPNAILSMLINSTSWIFGIIGSVALLAFVIGGVMWLVSAGNSALVDRGKQTMATSAIGLAVVFLSYSGVDLVLKTFGYYRYAEWSTLPQQADPQGVAVGPTVQPYEGPRTSYKDWLTGNYDYKPSIASELNDASPELVTFLDCIRDNLPMSIKPIITSISDSPTIKNNIQTNGSLDLCRDAYDSTNCVHRDNSCHYGGGKSQLSNAADFRSDGSTEAVITTINNHCSHLGTFVDERKIPGVAPHLHIQTKNCSKRY